MIRRKFVLAAAAAAFFTAALAQTDKKKEDPTVRSVEGTVTDEQENMIRGAVVQLKNTKTLQVRSYITQENGKYQFQGLSTNIDYELKANHQSKVSDAKILSSFDSRKRAIINLRVESKKK